jgi:hypothetical protein
MSDLAAKLDMVTLPIPSEQRIDIYVVKGTDAYVYAVWTRQTGISNFHWAEETKMPGTDAAKFCGVCLCSGEGPFTQEQWTDIKPFFKRAGTEANVFVLCPWERRFFRRDVEWFESRIQ